MGRSKPKHHDSRSQGPLHVAVAVLRDSTAIVPIGVAELLKKVVVEGAAPGMPPVSRAVTVSLVGSTRTVRTSNGYPVHCDATFDEITRCDIAVVPALDADVDVRLAQNSDAVAWAGRVYRRGADVCSVCTGAFVLAEAGLLDGRRATTHWAFAEAFAQRYPRVTVEPAAILVDQGRVITAGGATSFINLTQYLVERALGPELATAASKMFLIDVNKAPQTAYAVFSSQRDHGDDDILRAQEAIERAPGRDRSVVELARAVGMSSRNFVRRFKDATGNTPRDYIARVRVEHAKRALETTTLALSAIASKLGYRDPVAFRRLFTRETGLTPAAHRRRYGRRTAPSMITVPRRAA